MAAVPTDSDNSKGGEEDLPVWVIIMIVVVVLSIACVVGFFVWRARKDSYRQLFTAFNSMNKV